MTEFGADRLGAFFGVLVLSAALFFVVSAVAEIRIAVLGMAYMFTPLLAGLVVCLLYGVSLWNVGLGLGRRRWLAASVLVGLTLIGLTLAVSLAVPNIGFDPTGASSGPSGMAGVLTALAATVAIGITINAVTAFGEEFGWRGYLLWELAPLGFWKASVAIGAVWGLWHAPAIITGAHPRFSSFPFLGVAMMTAACISLSPIYTYLVIRAESVLAAALLHGIFNSSAALVLVYVSTDSVVLDELVASPLGVAGIVACGLVAVGIAVRGTPTLDRTYVGDSSGGPEFSVSGDE